FCIHLLSYRLLIVHFDFYQGPPENLGIDTHIHIHTHRHTHTHTHKHSHTHTHIHMHTNTHTTTGTHRLHTNEGGLACIWAVVAVVDMVFDIHDYLHTTWYVCVGSVSPHMRLLYFVVV